MNVKISKLIINNFRCVKHAEYDLSDKNIFAGPNYTGKTTTVLAVYWVLTGKMLDGSSDDDSNKPHERLKEDAVSVELIFNDGFSYKKEFKENWVTKRGSKEEIMEGHITNIYINDDKYGVGEGNKELIKYLGLNKKLEAGKFDLMRAIIDPLYIGLTCDWKTLRSFVIELVGDVSNGDVLATDDNLIEIKEELEKYNYDTSKMMKGLKQHINASKDEIKTKKATIKELNKVEDLDPVEKTSAEEVIKGIDEDIAGINNQKVSNVNEKLNKLEKDYAAKQVELSTSMNSDREELINKNKDKDDEINLIKSELMTKSSLLETLSNKKFDNERYINALKNELLNLKNDRSRKEENLEKGRLEYASLFNSEFVTTIDIPDTNACPNCGYDLNTKLIESVNEQVTKHKEQFEKDKLSKIEENIKKGKALVEEIKNIDFKIEELEKKINGFSDMEIDAKISDTNNEKLSLSEKISLIEKDIINEYTSESTISLRNDVARLREQIDIEKRSTNDIYELDDKISKLKSEKHEYEMVIMKHNLYLSTQKDIKRINDEIDVIINNQCAYESTLILVEKFIQIKLSMLTSNVIKVFGTEVEFVLVETNIKEGSWNEVCYPLIKGKKASFKNSGSDSEMVITGVYIAECIKKKMELNDLPYIFDRCEGLDNNTLSKLIVTESQIITAKVENIEKLTLVH